MIKNFHKALLVPQRQVDELDNMKESHYRDIVEHEEQVWDVQVKEHLSKVLYPSVDRIFLDFRSCSLDYG